MLTSTEEVFFKSALGLAKQLQAAGMEVLKPAAFEPGNFKTATLSETVRRSGFQIMVLLSYEDDTHTVAFSARKQGMMSSGWAWVQLIIGHAVDAMHGWVNLRPLLPLEGMQAFAEQVSDYSKSTFNISVSADSVDLTHSVALYDAIMLYAHAATRVLSEGGNLNNGRALTEAMRSAIFPGVGGKTVKLDKHGDRIDSYEVINYILKADGVMGSVPVGSYNEALQQYRAYGEAVVWPGGSTEVPVDYFSGVIDTVAQC